MASINSFGLGHEYRDGGRWSHGGSGGSGRPQQQASSALSSYKGGEGVNVDQLGDDDSDCDRGENGGGGGGLPRSAAQRAKDRAQQPPPGKGGAKVAAAKGRRKLREKRRGTGVVHLPANDQSTGDSLDDEDDDDGGTKQNTSSNEVSSSASSVEPMPPSAAGRAGAGSNSDPVPEHVPKFGQRGLSSSGYGKSWQQEMAAAATAAGVSAEMAAGGSRLHGDSPSKDDGSAGPALRSCLKGAAGAAKDAPVRRPVTSLVSHFEQNKPALPSANGSSSSVPSAGPAGSAVRGAREEGPHVMYGSQFRGPKEEEASRGSVPTIASAAAPMQRAPGDSSGQAAAAAAVRQSPTAAQPSSTGGPGVRSAASANVPTTPAQSTRAPVLPPWKQQQETAPAAAAGGGIGGGTVVRAAAPAIGAAAASSGVGSATAARPVTISEDYVLPPGGTASVRLSSDQHKRPDVAGERLNAPASDDVLRKNSDLQKAVEQLQAENGQLHKLLLEREREVERLKRDILEKDAHIAELDSTISSLDRDLDELDHDNINLAEENEALRKAVATLSAS